MHDPATVAYLINPGLFGTESWPIRVETEGFSRGKTWPSLGDTDEELPLAWQRRPLVNVCTSVDGERAAGLVEERLGRRGTTAGRGRAGKAV